MVVGVNEFIAQEERGIPTLRIDPQTATNENLLPAILGAVEAYATVGEISDALRRAFGEYRESVVI